jgi:hypothetical protein
MQNERTKDRSCESKSTDCEVAQYSIAKSANRIPSSPFSGLCALCVSVVHSLTVTMQDRTCDLKLTLSVPPRLRGEFALLLAASLLVGCEATKPADPVANTEEPAQQVTEQIQMSDVPRIEDFRPADAAPTLRKVYELEIYQLAVPRGTISSNDEFWKRLDENCLDFTTHQTLAANGIRVATAPQTEMQHLKAFIDDPEAKVAKIIDNRAENVFLEMATGIREQRLWWYDRRGELVGRVYRFSDNLVYFSFRQTPRTLDKVTVSLAPAVKSTRQEYKVFDSGAEQRIDVTVPESIYDLGLKLDLSLDHFLVIAPSAVAKEVTNVGQNFFIRRDPAQEMERVLVIVPTSRGTMEMIPVVPK